MSFGAVLGGALQGIGAGMQQQAQARMASEAEQTKETAALRREVFLENLRSQNTAARDKAQSENRIGEMTAGAKLDDWKDSRGNARKTASTIAIDAAKAKNDLAVQKAVTAFKLDADKQIIAAKLASDLAMAGQEVGEMKVTADGQLRAYSKTGTLLGMSDVGKFRPDGKADDPLGGGAFPGAPGALPGAPPAIQQKQNRPPLTSFDR